MSIFKFHTWGKLCRGALLLMAMTSLGCATRAIQTEALIAEPQGLPVSHLIQDVPFIDQNVNLCGPATLTMAMQQAGLEISVDEIAAQVFTPGLNGSLQASLISTTRRHGMLAVPLDNLRSVLAEVAASHPVIIFENLGLSWAPQWHYALVIGYDLTKQEVIMHSGHQAYFRWDMKRFERSWMLADYWALVILPAGELANSATEVANLSAAVGLELANKTMAAEKSYLKILEKWPQSLVATVGLANIEFKRGHHREATHLLEKAHRAHPESLEVKHNLQIARESQAR